MATNKSILMHNCMLWVQILLNSRFQGMWIKDKTIIHSNIRWESRKAIIKILIFIGFNNRSKINNKWIKHQGVISREIIITQHPLVEIIMIMILGILIGFRIQIHLLSIKMINRKNLTKMYNQCILKWRLSKCRE